MEKSIELINGKSRIVATFDIPWGNPEKKTVNGKEEEVRKTAKVKIKKFTFGEYNDLQKACMKMTMFGGNPKLDIDPVAMNEQAILKSIIEAPFQINDLNAIRDLDREIAEILLAKINELNMPSEKKI